MILPYSIQNQSMTRKPATILLVEDDQSMLEGIKDLLSLSDIGYEVEVLTAGNGRIGLEILSQRTPDLIISDIMMPELDGFEFLQRLRQNPNWVLIPVIFLTAKGSKRDVHKGKTSGADLYVTKPFNSVEFIELVSGQLKRAFQLSASRQQSIGRLKKDILQILNHEFRTPLTYVTAYYEMLADSLNHMREEENFQEFLRGIQVGCVRLTRLVEDFIRVLDIRTGEMQSRFQEKARPVPDLDHIIQQAVINVQHNSPHYQIDICYESRGGSLPLVWGDADGLREVFERLLQNAVKFTATRKKTEGRVTVETEVATEQIRIAFIDEGIGFPPHVKDELFDLFFQYNRGVLEQQGAGTGLTIAKSLVDLHGGKIEAENRPNDGGSVFTVWLPVYHPGRKLVNPELNSGSKKQAVVLIVEDDPYLLAGLQELLEIFNGPYKLRVLTANNGRAALDVLTRQTPDLIISDIMMPEMGGYEFLEKVRQNPEWVQVPVIFLTAKGERDDIHRGRRSGVEEYITKPYDSEELLELVVSQLNRYFAFQGALSQDFEELKRSILQLITPAFRLPLSTVSKYSNQLVSEMAGAETDQDLRQSLFGIKEGSSKLYRLVEDLIFLAELETGEAETAFSLRAQPVRDLGIYLYEAGQMHAVQAQRQGIFIHCPLNTDVAQVYSDGVSLQICLQRLVELALNYCANANYQGRLEMQAANVDEEVHLILHLPTLVPAPDAAVLRGYGNTTVSADVDPAIRILKGVVALHNGRIILREHNINGDAGSNPTAEIIIALPVYKAVTPNHTTFDL